MKGFITTILRLAVLLLLLSPAGASAGVEIMNIRHWTATDHTRIVIDTGGAANYKLDKADKKLTIDFLDAVPSRHLPRRLVLNKPGIEKIQTTRLRDGTLRVELFLPGGVESKVFKLKKFQDKPDRVVIDIGLPDVEKQERISRKEVKVQRKARIVVIDPGHGGDDPGAIGKSGTREKTVVLAISRKLRDILNNRKEGYRAFLTRRGDYYVSFNKRLTIAREYGADLFVSIHADAFRGRSARGSSVYCLSLKGASSEAGKILAKNENLSDVVGGVSDAESSDESDPIVLNMFQTNTINLSKSFGAQVIRHLNGVGHIKHAVVQEAPFRVLKLPDIPSLLIETAFISNPGEEQLLKSGRHQTRLANAVADAIVEFIPYQPPERPKTFMVKDQGGKAAGGRDKKRPAFHRVKRGDTIASIAKRYDATIAVLLKLNGMKLDAPLFVDRKIKLPPPEQDRKPERQDEPGDSRRAKKGGIATYRVAKGDTLAGIAGRFEVDTAELASFNGMEVNDPLHAGRLLKIPERAKREGGQKKDGRESAVSPETGKPDETPAKTRIYRVKEGDTVLIIARKCNTTIGELLRLNSIGLADALHVDQELIVPAEPPE